jgi:hypothetical protein
MSQNESENPGGESAGPVDIDTAFNTVLGYLNFSGGAPDSTFLRSLNTLAVESGFADGWQPLRELLSTKLDEVEGSSPTFSDVAQARSVITIVFDSLLPAYQDFHADLLFHLEELDHQNPFFLGRCFEAVLAQGGPWDEVDRVVSGALDELNDFLGFRPLAVLENGRKMTPYEHERCRPLPLFIDGAGACSSPYRLIVEQAIFQLADTHEDVLLGAHFDLKHLSELALDLRAYDHDHPVFKRTNYLFGEWDPHVIDNSGFYRRFIVRKIILDALVGWVSVQDDQDEALFDAGAVLCGTILMASAVSGDGPSCHDSGVTLTSLLPLVARQRDDFYDRLMSGASGSRAKRLREAQETTQQPFGHVRQTLNLYLAHYGAGQVQHRQLANVYARMGYPEASREQSAAIPSVAARFECEVQWRITGAKQLIERSQIDEGSALLLEIEDLIHRGIGCGAFVDPWNILAFQGNFPLFSSREDSIPDQRVEVILDLMERLFGVFSQAVAEAAAQGRDQLVEELAERFEQLADYWDQFAAHVIEDLPKVFGHESLESARHVAEALAEWRAAGEGAGDISFWRKHVDRFNSAKAYACVVEALLAKGDHVAAMSLLVQWLSVSEEVGIESGPYSIHAQLLDWINDLTANADGELKRPVDWDSIRRLFDFLEVNAGEYWEVPTLDGAGRRSSRDFNGERPLDEWAVDPNDEDWIEDEEDKLFEAAYDGIVYQDSTNDGVDAEILDSGNAPGTTEFEILNRQLEPRIKFIMALAQLWQVAAASFSAETLGPAGEGESQRELDAGQTDKISEWRKQVRLLQDGLLDLLNSVWERDIDETGGDHDANVEYDIQLQTKFYLLNTIIATHINCRVAEVSLLCLLPSVTDEKSFPADDREMIEFYRSVVRRDIPEVRKRLPKQFQRLRRKPLLYVPLDGGGDPMQILAARTVQTDIRFLLKQMPRLGLLRETWHVVKLAHRMERETRPGQMAVTEFDRIFRTGLRNTMDCLIESSATWNDGKYSPDDLIGVIGDVRQHYSDQWYRHSRTMRLSMAESFRDDDLWEDARDFIETFGEEFFHARSLTLGNVRTILHNGVEWFLEQLSQFDDPIHPNPLIKAMEEELVDTEEVVDMLEVIYGAVVDKFDRFLEYNTTTTQSDYGSKFYVLLDFLRVEAAYDRIAWERIPDGIVHRSLAMADKQAVLRILEDILEAETREDADEHIKALYALEDQYGVHLPSVSDRLNERFVKPLSVNRMLALVRPSIQTATTGEEAAEKFQLLREEIDAYMEDTAGSAIDIPQWLQDVEREVSRQEMPSDYIRPAELEVRLPTVLTTEQDVRGQLETWAHSIGEERSRKKPTRRRRNK